MTQDYTLSDIAAVSGKNNNNDGIFGGNGAWFLIILFLFAFMGWGGGWGGNRGGNGTDGGVMNNYVLNSDFSTLSRQIDSGFASQERKLDGINNGLCSGFYQQAQLINGVNAQNSANTAAIQQTLTQGFAGLNTGMVQQGYETRIGINGIGQQMATCCCDLKGGIADLKYTVAQGNNAVTNAIGFASRDIIDNQNANYRALHDEIVANRIEDKNAQIAALQQQLFAQQLESSQAVQTNVLVDKLGVKCPIPAYLTCNPNAPLNYSVNYGGCGCGA